MHGGALSKKNHSPLAEIVTKERRWSPPHQTPHATQKKFLVFDQSGGQTMVFGCDLNVPFTAFNTTAIDESRNVVKNTGIMFESRVAYNHPTENAEEECFRREDTDELNALLYSSSDGRFEENDVDSTGHSPGIVNEASSDEQWKKRKYVWDDDAESRSVGECKKIRETVSLLQKILPDGASDDPLTVIEEAIEYLKRMKNKAKCLDLFVVSSIQ